MNVIYIACTLVVVVCVFYLATTYFKINKIKPDDTYLSSLPIKIISINGKNYDIWIVEDEDKRQRGLMYVKDMKKTSGMLFIFDSTSIYPIWMKNTVIPLDIIWISEEGNVVFIKENAKPCDSTIDALCHTIIPTSPARFILELNAGQVQKLGLKVGENINFKQ
ncbi:MAG: uncharacterized protein QG570_706 [Patescibacteria group bacterium]|nr:uncharacterized protein [Patescibacteria group bacterium]